MKSTKLILVRHGESLYNLQNRFTGWSDIELSQKGVEEAINVGRLLKKHRLYPDVCHTSWLKRAIHTAQFALNELEWEHIDVRRSYKLNERHYGAWQGKDKEEIRKSIGERKFLAVRRGYDVAPPPLSESDSHLAWKDKKYRNISKEELPLSESLKDTQIRVVEYFKTSVMLDLQQGMTSFVSAHGNSLRALVMHLEEISKEDVVNLEIPTGEILVYTFNESMQIIKKEVLL